ncbi:MAG: P-loop NTPase, partial [Proteobacteria bacterium]|nr:P-loop NTPase [Pseudomonadota bacterium]
ARAILVTTPQEVAQADIRKSISFCKVVHMEIFGILENMSGLKCPHCQKTIGLFGTGGGEQTAKSYSLPLLGKIPFDLEMVLCGDGGVAYLENFPNTDVSRTFREVADAMGKNRFEKTDSIANDQEIFVVPVADGKLTPHFHRCEQFDMIYVEDDKIVRKETRTPPPHEPDLIPKWLRRLGANVIIAGGMGQQAVDLFRQCGITVVTRTTVDDAETLVMSYLNNT